MPSNIRFFQCTYEHTLIQRVISFTEKQGLFSEESPQLYGVFMIVTTREGCQTKTCIGMKYNYVRYSTYISKSPFAHTSSHLYLPVPLSPLTPPPPPWLADLEQFLIHQPIKQLFWLVCKYWFDPGANNNERTKPKHCTD